MGEQQWCLHEQEQVLFSRVRENVARKLVTAISLPCKAKLPSQPEWDHTSVAREQAVGSRSAGWWYGTSSASALTNGKRPSPIRVCNAVSKHCCVPEYHSAASVLMQWCACVRHAGSSPFSARQGPPPLFIVQKELKSLLVNRSQRCAEQRWGIIYPRHVSFSD